MNGVPRCSWQLEASLSVIFAAFLSLDVFSSSELPEFIFNTHCAYFCGALTHTHTHTSRLYSGHHLARAFSKNNAFSFKQ